jgi:hypothetical protein
MKKILLAMFALLMTINVMAADELIYVKSGSANVLKEDAVSSFALDYSHVQVNEKASLDEYAKTRNDADFLENYHKDMAAGGQQFAKTYTKKSKGLKFDTAGGKYATTFTVEKMDMGNVGVGLFAWKKGQGGIGLVGDITVKDVATGETVLVLRVDNVKGLIDFSETSRIRSAFDELAKAIVKYVKKLN